MSDVALRAGPHTVPTPVRAVSAGTTLKVKLKLTKTMFTRPTHRVASTRLTLRGQPKGRPANHIPREAAAV